MAHLAPPVVPRRPAERLLGALLLIAGVALAFIAYSALTASSVRRTGSELLHPLATPPVMAGGQAVAGGASQAAPVPNAMGSGVAAAGVSLVVLDNTGRPDVARSATERFEQAGWVVTDTSTFDGDILSTAAYYDPSTPGAQAAAEALQTQFPEIQRVRPKFDGLGMGAVVVVLTYDYSQGQTTS